MQGGLSSNIGQQGEIGGRNAIVVRHRGKTGQQGRMGGRHDGRAGYCSGQDGHLWKGEFNRGNPGT